jgi:predicted dehydrogenase
MSKSVNVAMVGLGFGAEFIPIYQRHPHANVHAICRRDEAELNRIGDQFGIANRYTKFEQVLADPSVDFVHINSPIPDHGWMSIEALKAGKHVMCTVPMATTIEECEQICQLVKSTGLKYMMAETVVYSREFLFIREMYQKGELGKIQYMAASHPQDMDGWPAYWEKMIPMHYATHVVSPVLGLVDGRAEYVSCFGSGTVRDDIAKKSGNKYAVESCHIKIKDSDIAAHIWRFLYDTARQYRESFDVYGTKKSFEWSLVEHEPHILKGRGPRLCTPATRGNSYVYAFDSRRRSLVVHPGWWARWFAPALGQ